MEEKSRNQLQESAMTIIYDYLTYIELGKPLEVEETISKVLDAPYEECDDYVKAVSIAAALHLNEMVKIFDAHTKNWKFKRLNRVAQAILLLSYSSYVYVGNIDKKVIINVAVKLSKKFLDKDEHKFVNAILDKVLA